jgi:hypothetical protein
MIASRYPQDYGDKTQIEVDVPPSRQSSVASFVPAIGISRSASASSADGEPSTLIQ